MKEIFDNWKQFVNEQQPRTAEQRLDMFTRAVLDLNTTADDKKWQTIKARASRFPMKKVADMVRDKIYNTFASNIGEKSFVRLFMANKEAFRMFSFSISSFDAEPIDQYEFFFIYLFKYLSRMLGANGIQKSLNLIVELIFGIPGVARFALDAIFSRDYPIIMALTLIGTASLVVANLIVDILYVFLDPRIKYSNDN